MAHALVLNLLNAHFLRRRTGGDRDPRKMGKRVTVPNAALKSPPE